MIVAVDHIAISSNDLRRDVDVFERAGYRARFVQSDIPNPSGKKKYLSKYKALHDLSLLDAPTGFSVELMNHGSIMPNRPRLLPIVDPSAWPTLKTSGSHEVLCLPSGAKVPIIATTTAHTRGQIHACRVVTRDLEATISFWKAMGWVVEIHSKTAAKLLFSSPLQPNALTLDVRYDAQAPDSFVLDGTGATCIAMVCTNAAEQRLGLGKVKDIKVSALEHISVAEKQLTFFFAHNSIGDVAELISLAA